MAKRVSEERWIEYAEKVADMELATAGFPRVPTRAGVVAALELVRGFVQLACKLIVDLDLDLRDCRAEEEQWHNMVAVLCRDGGQYLHEHGVEKTKKHIIEQFHEQGAEIEQLKDAARVSLLRYTIVVKEKNILRAENERRERDNNHLTDMLIAAGFIGQGTEIVGVKYHEKLKADNARLQGIVEKLRPIVEGHKGGAFIFNEITKAAAEAAKGEE